MKERIGTNRAASENVSQPWRPVTGTSLHDERVIAVVSSRIGVLYSTSEMSLMEKRAELNAQFFFCADTRWRSSCATGLYALDLECTQPFQFPPAMDTLCFRLFSFFGPGWSSSCGVLGEDPHWARLFHPAEKEIGRHVNEKLCVVVRVPLAAPTWHGLLTGDEGDWTEHCRPDKEGPKFLNVPRQPACFKRSCAVR